MEKDSGFSSERKGGPWKGSEPGDENPHSGCCVGNRLWRHKKRAGCPLRRPHTVLIQSGGDEGDKKWFPFCMFWRQSQQNFLTEYM